MHDTHMVCPLLLASANCPPLPLLPPLLLPLLVLAAFNTPLNHTSNCSSGSIVLV